MSMRFKDKVVLVFGAGSSGPGWGNGKAAAALYAREGARVVAVDLKMDAAQETRATLREEGLDALALAADVTSAKEIASVVEQTMQAYGRIDVMHNNVGITIMGDPVELSEEDWHRGLDINLTSAFLSCKHVIPIMQAQGKGAIVNISSLASLQVNNYPYVVYQSAKAGLNHFTKSVAVRYAAQGIRANAVLPGVMDTPLIYKQIAGEFTDIDAMKRARNAASPMGRMGDAWDVAHAAAFLASDDAKYITGVILPVDGGKSCTGR